jgi:serine protease Do
LVAIDVKPATLKPFPSRSISALCASLAVIFSLLFPARTQAATSRGFNQLLDAVVRIDVRELAFEAGARRFTAAIGSGVLLSADGIVLTNAHVASPRSVEINVTLSNLERISAKLVGWDHWTDLAVLRIDMAEVKKRGWTLAHADFIPDDEKFYPGEVVFAVGTPHGLTRTVTRGIISNTSQYLEDNQGINGYETGMFNTWLQTDAAINPGNSGGPLVTEDGKVIGITSRGYLGANNLGFAIPASTARRVLEGLVRDGSITRSYIGIVPGALQDLENFYSLAINTGMLINSVETGSPAAKAGLRGGDILLAIDGQKVDGRFPEQLPAIQNKVASRAVGTSLKLTVKRGGETRDFSVVTEKLESRVGEEWALEKWGLSVRKVSRAYARENQLDDATGVVVIGVQPGFPADVAGLSRGDVIMKINQKAVNSLDVVKQTHADYEATPAPTLFEVQRNHRVSLYIVKP